MLVLPEGTTFYSTTKTTSPLCEFWGNKLQECVAASSLQALLASTGSEIMYIEFHRRKAMKQNVLTKQVDSFKIKFNNVI